jgi:hypothetical protein
MAKKKRVKKKKTKKELQKEKRIRKKEQIKSEDKILKNFFMGIGIVIVIIVSIILILNATKNFEYEGVKFRIVREGNLILYKTSLPITYQGKKISYNFYLRNDPRNLGKNIPFEGEVRLTKNLVINSTEGFNCNGDGIIAIGNLQMLYKLSGIKVIKDENATCDAEGRYAFIQLQAGNETSIEKFGPICYNVNINNCEILKALERLMLEYFIEINKLI